MEIDYKLSMQVAKILAIQSDRPYYNAWRALCYPGIPELNSKDTLYVEGYIVMYLVSHTTAATTKSPHAIPLGWLELNGKIIDPIYWKSEGTYFAGPRLSKDRVCRDWKEIVTFASNDDSSIIARICGDEMPYNAELTTAHEAAQIYIDTLT